MKKQILAATMALCMCLSPVGVFAEEASVESILEKVNAFGETTTSSTIDLTLSFDLTLTMGSEGAEPASIPIVATGDFDVQSINDPLQMSMVGTYDMSLMGQSMAMDMEMYMVQSEDGEKIDTFTKLDDGSGDAISWQHTQTDLAEVLSMFNVSSVEELEALDTAAVMDDLNLDWTAEEADDAYTLSSTLGFADIADLLPAALAAEGEEVPQEVMDMITSVMSGLMANIAITVDKETGAETAVHLDMNGSDLSQIAALIESAMGSSEDGEAMQLGLVLNDLSVDGACTYNNVTEIVVPADALATEVSSVDYSSLE